jgi:hypothetical protein
MLLPPVIVDRVLGPELRELSEYFTRTTFEA